MARKSEKPKEPDQGGADTTLALKDRADARAAFTRSTFILQKDGPLEVAPGHVIVVCRDPGLRRGGINHPPLHVYAPGELDDAQLRAMAGEPALEVIGVG